MRRAIAQNGIHYPVVQDNGYDIWNTFGNQYWPAKYLIDARGRVRYTHFGEGDYDKTESAIRALLARGGRPAAGSPRAGPGRRARGGPPDAGDLSRRKAGAGVDPDPARGRHRGLPGRRQPAATVTTDRLYRLVTLAREGEHRLRLRFAPGVSGYAFTFG